jgi:hypothetical protein
MFQYKSGAALDFFWRLVGPSPSYQIYGWRRLAAYKIINGSKKGSASTDRFRF